MDLKKNHAKTNANNEQKGTIQNIAFISLLFYATKLRLEFSFFLQAIKITINDVDQHKTAMFYGRPVQNLIVNKDKRSGLN
ncbi:hypothetical protein [Gaoshiqia sediminis]|uniref:Uncharacterized protein n=1 Tax=Gaoshiqia sediminis TaxID=2986998 RepID=A0AA42C8J1_9BACT|nr:hypothetical protein [Gaoshiqia sediminis]MCW0482776.1 hypothetical protein [Gaoshiqia sediminis]